MSIRSTRLTAAGAAAAIAVVLTGCGGEAAPTATETVTVEAPPTEEPESTETETTDEPTEEPTTEEPDAAGGAAATGEVPAPGTAVSVGDAVTLHRQVGEEGDQYYGYALISTTVTEITELDKSLFEEASNASDFAGLTPWMVQTEFEWTTYEGEPNDNMIPRIGAVNSSGGELSPVRNTTWSAGIPGCEIQMPDTKGVGEQASNCAIFAVPDGESIGAAVWRGDDTIDGYGTSDGNEYYADPIRWESD